MPGKPNAYIATKVTGIYRRNDSHGKPGKWYARYTKPDGKRAWSEPLASFEAAKARLAEISGKIHKGETVGDNSTTIADLVETWQATRVNKKARTRETQNSHIRLYIVPAIGRMKVREVTEATVDEWYANLRRQDGTPFAGASKDAVHATLCSLLKHAKRRRLISVNPALGIEKPVKQDRVARILRDGELDSLLATCRTRRIPWLAPLIEVAAGTGLRLGEVLGLNWGDLDPEAGVIHVRRNYSNSKMGTPKSGRTDQTAPFSTKTQAVLEAHRKEALGMDISLVGADKPVFVNGQGNRRQSGDVQRAFDRIRTYAGISTEPRNLTFHDLRHTIATELMHAGVPIADVQQVLRHSQQSTTIKFYGHQKPDPVVTAKIAAVADGILG